MPSPEQAASWLASVPDDKLFYLHMGPPLHDLRQLADALESAPPAIFRHHVNSKRNDFSAWVRDVIGDHELAEKLLKTTSQKKAVRAVRARIKMLEAAAASDPLRAGAPDFLIGMIVGVIAGVIIAAIVG